MPGDFAGLSAKVAQRSVPERERCWPASLPAALSRTILGLRRIYEISRNRNVDAGGQRLCPGQAAPLTKDVRHGCWSASADGPGVASVGLQGPETGVCLLRER